MWLPLLQLPLLNGRVRMLFEPIGFFKSDAKYKIDAPRQATLDRSGSIGRVELMAGCGYEQALTDLDGFERAWLIYGFHLAKGWKPMTTPPRGPAIKRGLFATRSPYRPNKLGLSCVQIVAIRSLTIEVLEHDLLDGAPIYDVKPYLPYADAFPHARGGWTDELNQQAWSVQFAPEADSALNWLEANEMPQLRAFLNAQLGDEPLDRTRKRVRINVDAKGLHEIAYRTWRAEFTAKLEDRAIEVLHIRSGYLPAEIAATEDKYEDKALHAAFALRTSDHCGCSAASAMAATPSSVALMPR